MRAKKKKKKPFQCFTRNSSKSTNPLGDATADTLPRNRYVWIPEFGKSGWMRMYVKEKEKKRNPAFVFLAADFGPHEQG